MALPQHLSDDTVCGKARIDANSAGKSSGQSSIDYLDADAHLGARMNQNIAAAPEHATEPLPEVAEGTVHPGSAKVRASETRHEGCGQSARQHMYPAIALHPHSILQWVVNFQWCWQVHVPHSFLLGAACDNTRPVLQRISVC